MLFKRNSFIVLGACLLFAQGCLKRPPERRVDPEITHEISPEPPLVGRVTITLRIRHYSGEPVTGVQPIAIEGNMSHAGMTPVFVEAKEIGNGVYRASMELSMPGDWVIVARGTLPNGLKFEYQFEIKGVSPL